MKGMIVKIDVLAVVILVLTSLVLPVCADVLWSGDVVPADPTTWDSGTYGYIGETGYGTMDITGGSDVLDFECYIGRNSGSTGEVTVDGADSTWTNNDSLSVGVYGSGTLNITDGGLVSVQNNTWVSESGTIHFGKGTLVTGGLGCSFDNLTGTGTINTGGLVSDVNMVFDAGHGLSKIFSINNNPGQNVTVNLDVDGSGVIGVGYSGVGTMSISDGIVVESTYGYIGQRSGATGEVTVDGGNSMWTNNYSLRVGSCGNGTLNITGGGTVSNSFGFIGAYGSATGVVTVDGIGSTWTNNSGLSVGSLGNGTLNITNGGNTVSNNWSNIGQQATGEIKGEVTVDGANSTWTNNGNLSVGVYGSGTLNITGGGLVSVAETLTIDYDTDGDGFINMATGGMLALFGDADDSLIDFMGLIDGTDAIRYWDDSILGWADITGATYGDDYTLEYLSSGDLQGYTMLTVTVIPEPGTVFLLALGGMGLLRRRRVEESLKDEG